MTNAFINEFDDMAHEAFADAGLADAGTFKARLGVVMPCKVFVDRDPVTAALSGIEITKDQAVIRLLRAGITGEPRNDDVITVDAEVFTIARRVRSDESSWVFLCQA